MRNKYDRPFSEKEFLIMQQEAIERAREMQKRSRFPIEYYTIPEQPFFSKKKMDAASPEAKKGKKQTVHIKKEEKATPQTSLFEALLSDKETLLILIVLYFLIKEQADQILILALVYVLL